ncbi:MAG: hypothetical protein E6G68_05895 [Actinobacteria bacterium]|nr:MAG: hypothetical protein E6G68_05895 [Actinomycetota bacterium]
MIRRGCRLAGLGAVAAVLVTSWHVASATGVSVVAGAGSWGNERLAVAGLANPSVGSIDTPTFGKALFVYARVGVCTRGPCQVTRAAVITASCQRFAPAPGGGTAYVATGTGTDGLSYAIEIIDRSALPSLPGVLADQVGVTISQIPLSPCTAPSALHAVELGGFVVR